MSKRQLLLLSSSNFHGHEYLQFAKDWIVDFLKKNNADKVLFIPYASAKPNSYGEYTEKVRSAMKDWNLEVTGIHESPNPVEAVKQAKAIFIGGGNTFLLLKTLYEQHLVEEIRSRVLDHGVPYIGSSAGTNVATHSIHTTNDMPIALPPTFYALQLIPFNINPHYLDPIPDSKHQGETRAERIKEFHYLNSNPVLGLREGSALLIDDDNSATLIGHTPAVVFSRENSHAEFPVDSDLRFLFSK
ncbi:CLUMA_CG017431, isoform A [Clunio marinus]|uniref:dipeptidase E n=1 Tax=Clunio marinus TaxID=568069 RepID=A0A1J1IXA5_9DIPT|nr:CLUMA_CG017431, isoform A [Clunio marinus]